MTIKEATERYIGEGEVSASPALREVINYMIDRNIRTEFSNDSYLDALTLTNVMFSRSTRSIRMLTGPHGNGFLKCLEKPLIGALERIRANSGEVRIIILGRSDRCLDELQQKFSGTLAVIPAQSTAPLRHFTVCDSKMARLEEIHEALTPETPASAIKARVYFNDPVKSKTLEDTFDQIWQRLKKLTASPQTAQNEAVHAH